MTKKRSLRLNSLLQEVLSDVIRKDVRDPRVAPIVSITRVSITDDLQHAKVYISVIGTPQQKEDTVDALQSAAGFIAITASKQVTMRYFPALTFLLDHALEEQLRIDSLLTKIHLEEQQRPRASE